MDKTDILFIGIIAAAGLFLVHWLRSNPAPAREILDASHPSAPDYVSYNAPWRFDAATVPNMARLTIEGTLSKTPSKSYKGEPS